MSGSGTSTHQHLGAIVRDLRGGEGEPVSRASMSFAPIASSAARRATACSVLPTHATDAAPAPPMRASAPVSAPLHADTAAQSSWFDAVMASDEPRLMRRPIVWIAILAAALAVGWWMWRNRAYSKRAPTALFDAPQHREPRDTPKSQRRAKRSRATREGSDTRAGATADEDDDLFVPHEDDDGGEGGAYDDGDDGVYDGDDDANVQFGEHDHALARARMAQADLLPLPRDDQTVPVDDLPHEVRRARAGPVQDHNTSGTDADVGPATFAAAKERRVALKQAPSLATQNGDTSITGMAFSKDTAFNTMKEGN